MGLMTFTLILCYIRSQIKSKSVFLLGDFNVDQLKYDHHVPTSEFLDSLSSHVFLPHIIQPTRVTSNSKTLIDKIISIPDSVSGSLTATVSDHLPQVVVVSKHFSNPPLGSKSDIYERVWDNFDQENFILDYLARDFSSVIKKEQAGVNLSFQSFLIKPSFTLHKYVPLKKVSKHKLKFKS